MTTENNFFPVTIKEVPRKSEIMDFINTFIELPNYRADEKYVILKAYEFFIKESIAKLKKPAIESFLQQKEGVMNDYVFGANVKVTAERKDVTRKKYIYSKVVTDIENEIEKKENELKLLQEKLRLRQTLEINQGIAGDSEELIGKSETQYGITVTLGK